MSDFEKLALSLEKLEIYKAELEAQNEELRDKEEQLKEKSFETETLFLEAPIPYIVMDKNYNIVRYNNKAEKLFYLNEIKSKKSKIFSFYFIKDNLNKFLDWILNKEFLNNPINLEITIKNKTEIFKIEASEYLHKKDFLMISLSSIQKEMDLFKESKKKDHLLEAQSKMALLGEMLNNISHQWRQPLSTMTVAASGIKLKKEMNDLEDSSLNEFLDIILTNANFLSKTIDDFRNFALNKYENQNFNIKTSIEKVINIFKSKLSNRNIKVILQMDSFTYNGSESQLMQVFINFFSNAIDQFEQIKDINKLILIKSKKSERSLNISFMDNAGGINAKIREKIFEPYFTTKHKSVGTGIGLYMSAKIIEEQFKGTITCKNKIIDLENNSEQGASFKIKLPISYTTQ